MSATYGRRPLSATYQSENRDNYKFYSGEYVFYDSSDLSWPFYGNLNDQHSYRRVSASVCDLVGDL